MGVVLHRDQVSLVNLITEHGAQDGGVQRDEAYSRHFDAVYNDAHCETPTLLHYQPQLTVRAWSHGRSWWLSAPVRSC